jgi:hypothetical protein
MTAEALYHLVDLKSSNVAGSYHSVDAALDDLTNAIQKHGIEAAEGYIPLLIEGEDQSVYAQPEELIDLAKDHMSRPSH